MNSKIKTILSYIGVGLLGSLIGIGALIGVSSCSQQREETTTPLKRIAKPKYKKVISNYEDIFENDNKYYFVAKNYASDGEGVFYQGSISLDNSRIVSSTGGYLATTDTAIPLIVIRNSNYEQLYLNFSPHLSGGVYHLQFVYFSGSSLGNSEYIYDANNGLFNRKNCAFIGTQLRNRYAQNDLSVIIYYLSTFFDIYDLTQPVVQYDFTSNFNYNNFYQSDSTFLNRGNTPVVNAAGSTSRTFTYSLPWFSSNGIVFDKINVYFYVTAYNYFEERDGSWNKYESNIANNYYYYFHHMEYVNSATNYTITACNRVIAPYHEVGWTAVYKNVAWTSDGFQKLSFESKILDLRMQNILNSLTSDTIGGFTEIKNDIDIGLGNVFHLLSLAFASWVPILSIQIVPGVSIGLLMFLPLIAGIIVLVIWIVKR